MPLVKSGLRFYDTYGPHTGFDDDVDEVIECVRRVAEAPVGQQITCRIEPEYEGTVLLHGIESPMRKGPVRRASHIRPISDARRMDRGHTTKIYEETLRAQGPRHAVSVAWSSSIVGSMTPHSASGERDGASVSRRQLLGGGLAGASILLAGCSGKSATGTTRSLTSTSSIPGSSTTRLRLH